VLVLQQLDVENFGPFVGKQSMAIPPEGVTVVYGENGRGKTSLLNAIRYAFFGEVLSRGERKRRLHDIGNRDTFKEGVYGFKVTLQFAFDGDDYELTRSCQPRKGIDVPRSDEDYEQKVLVKAGEKVLSTADRDLLIKQALPREVARFFLFDGELLQQYEELLINESDIGPRISREIERILGVPILQHARNHLLAEKDVADKEVAKVARANDDTREKGVILEQQMDRRASLDRDRTRFVAERDAAEADKQELDTFLKSQQRLESWIAERASREDALADAKRVESEALVSVREAMADAWTGLLGDPLAQAQAYAEREVQKAMDQFTLSLRADAVDQGTCAVCEHDLSAGEKAELAASLPAGESHTGMEHVANAFARATSLTKLTAVDRGPEVERLWNTVDTSRIQQRDATERIKEIDEQLSGAAPDQVVKSRSNWTKLIETLKTLRDDIKATEDEIGRLDQEIGRLRAEIDAARAGQYSSSGALADLLSGAADVFGAAIEEYKSALRKRVEADASRFFLQMTTETEDYKGLQMNDSYGLAILHQDGRIEEARSAGQEHVVALSLMAALQRNAPIGGPIVMDSPFGRLDEGHTGNVVGALPDMADQCVLFVYRSEVDEDAMRTTLKTDLVAEYRLDRISSRHTELREERAA
jgi:DNA sulfur modification protein DndD